MRLTDKGGAFGAVYLRGEAVHDVAKYVIFGKDSDCNTKAESLSVSLPLFQADYERW